LSFGSASKGEAGDWVRFVLLEQAGPQEILEQGQSGPDQQRCYFGCLAFDRNGLHSRTPGPPPFSSMNSTRDFVKLQAIVKTSSFGFVSPKIN
jgi:hypothetical protein